MRMRMAYAHAMTSKNSLVRDSLGDKIVTFLTKRRRSKFRCFEIAAALDLPVQPVANECGRLARRGMLVREGSEDRTKPTFYRLPPKS